MKRIWGWSADRQGTGRLDYGGGDNGEIGARVLYWVTGSLALSLTVYHIVIARLKTSKAISQPLTGNEFTIALGTRRNRR